MEKNIFYHLPNINDSLQRFLKTYEKIQNSELIKKVNNMFVVTNISGIKFLNLEKVSFIIHENEFFENEHRTIMYMHEYAKNHKGYSLYLHCKGCFRLKPHQQKPRYRKPIQDWINLMEFFVIDKHELCFSKLQEGYSSVGVNYRKDPEPHYSGNFWWASNEYLKTIPRLTGENRLDGEFWISRGTMWKMCELHDSKLNHYKKTYDPKNYKY